MTMPRNIGSGFAFVTSRLSDNHTDAFVVLGARENQSSHTGMEYVTGVTDDLAPRAGWVWGHYFTDFDKAVEDFNKR